MSTFNFTKKFFPALDDALLGVAFMPNSNEPEPRAVYDGTRLVQVLVEAGFEWEEAAEFVEANLNDPNAHKLVPLLVWPAARVRAELDS